MTFCLSGEIISLGLGSLRKPQTIALHSCRVWFSQNNGACMSNHYDNCESKMTESWIVGLALLALGFLFFAVFSNLLIPERSKETINFVQPIVPSHRDVIQGSSSVDFLPKENVSLPHDITFDFPDGSTP